MWSLLFPLMISTATPLTWTACRSSPVYTPASLSSPTWTPPNTLESCIPAQVPGTVLGALLSNNTFSPITDPFLDDALAQLPDISLVGAPFYTFVFQTPLSSAAICGGTSPPPTGSRVRVTVGQLSYRAALFVDGAPVPPLRAAAAMGHWRRWSWDLGEAQTWCSSPAHGLAIEVSPPDHPGNASNTCTGCGQGGNHQLAQDITPQDSAGWDWVAGIPDRNTGLLDAVAVEVVGSVVLSDPAVAVTNLVTLPSPSSSSSSSSSLTASITIALSSTAGGGSDVEGVLTVAVPGVGFLASSPITTIPPGGDPLDITLTQTNLTNVTLWWPHTHGTPYLYDGTATFHPTSPGAAPPPRSLSWRCGFRTVSGAVDEGLGGMAFSINSQRVFLVGGNYITSDALARAQYRTRERYLAEVRMHAWGGLNVMRLWGGHGGHGEGLWQAADEVGVLLFHEFWQSGDNNGRWGGNASWPLDHAAYFAAATDTVRLARSHPSLLLHCGGNELYPLSDTWAPRVLEGIVSAHDPRGPVFMHSSMGSGPNGTSPHTYTPFDPTKVLAPTDGDYGINDEREYYQRNPGLGEAARILLLAFQPEIGNTAHPTFDSLSRFLSPSVREALPPPQAGTGSGNASIPVHPVWDFHRYLPFTNALGVDHLYALTPSANGGTATPGFNAKDYSLAAALAQRAQYQALFEGFSDGAFVRYSGVIMWKSAAPWPSFRGALYDWYLAQSGGIFGARAALNSSLHAQLNRANNSITLLNRGLVPLEGVGVTVQAFDVETGQEAALDPPLSFTVPMIGPLSTLHLPNSQLLYPPGVPSNATLLWRLRATPPPPASASATDYTLNTLGLNATASPQDFGGVARLRWDEGGKAVPGLHLVMGAPVCRVVGGGGGGMEVTLSISLHPSAGRVALGVLLVLRDGESSVTAASGAVDDRVLPQWPNDGLFALVPGEERGVIISAGPGHAGSKQLYLGLEGWNVVEDKVAVTC